jgi:hypothetical protein
MSMSTSTTRVRAAWREPMLWLVFGLPFAVVVAGIATLLIALRAGGADVVPTTVRRTAQIQVEELAADREALRLALAGDLIWQPDTGALRLQLRGLSLPADAELRLHLTHPRDAAADRELRLVRGGDAWHGRLDPGLDLRWNLELVPPDARWRLAGRWERGMRSVALRPRLQE